MNTKHTFVRIESLHSSNINTFYIYLFFNLRKIISRLLLWGWTIDCITTKSKIKDRFVVALLDPLGTISSCMRNERLPERLQNKLSEETTHGNRVNIWLSKVELKANLEQCKQELERKETTQQEVDEHRKEKRT